MVRFIFILIGAYNFFILLRVWALASNYLGRILPNSLLTFNTVLYFLFAVFVIIHSIRLIMLKKHSMLIQTVLCSIDPFIRIITTTLVIKSSNEMVIPVTNVLITQMIFIIIDICIIFYLRSNNVKKALKHAEVWKEEKFRKKLMKKNMDNIS